jgi:hypothetical protein
MKKIIIGLFAGAILSTSVMAKESTVINGMDFGPLAQLVGTWKTVEVGGVDVAPDQIKKGEDATTPFYEVITFEVAADATNANKQHLNAIYYKQEVFRKSDGSKFHDERGYFIYDKANKMVYNSFCVPRATCISAEGKASNSMILEAKNNGVAESEFMSKNASTTNFTRTIEVEGDTLQYGQTIGLDIYGKKMIHTDTSTLKKVK